MLICLGMSRHCSEIKVCVALFYINLWSMFSNSGTFSYENISWLQLYKYKFKGVTFESGQLCWHVSLFSQLLQIIRLMEKIPNWLIHNINDCCSERGRGSINNGFNLKYLFCLYKNPIKRMQLCCHCNSQLCSAGPRMVERSGAEVMVSRWTCQDGHGGFGLEWRLCETVWFQCQFIMLQL